MNAKLIGLVGAALLAAGAGTWWFWPFGKDRDTLQLPGTVEIQEVRLGSKVGGRVEEVLVNEHDVVEPGRLLVKLEAPELRAQKEQLLAAVAQAEADREKAYNGPRPEEKEYARATLDAAEARYLRLKNGFRPEEKDQAKAELTRAEVDLKWARQRWERVQRLVPGVTTTQEERDEAMAGLTRAQAEVNAARAKADMMTNGSRQEDIDEAEAMMKQALAKWKELEAGTRAEDKKLADARLQEARGRLAEVEAKLAEAEVRAPEKAVVDVLAIRKGDIAQPNQPLVRVLRADDLWVKVFVPETDLGKIRLGQEAQVRVDGYPDKRFRGTVVHISSISEFTPRNVQSPDERRHQVFGVKVRVDDPQGVFKAGMAADVWLPLH